MLEARHHIGEIVEGPFGRGGIAVQGFETRHAVALIRNELASLLELSVSPLNLVVLQTRGRPTSRSAAATFQYLSEWQLEDQDAVLVSDVEIIRQWVAALADGLSPYVNCGLEGFKIGSIRIWKLDRIVCSGLVELVAIEMVEKEPGNVGLPRLSLSALGNLKTHLWFSIGV